MKFTNGDSDTVVRLQETCHKTMFQTGGMLSQTLQEGLGLVFQSRRYKFLYSVNQIDKKIVF